MRFGREGSANGRFRDSEEQRKKVARKEGRIGAETGIREPKKGLCLRGTMGSEAERGRRAGQSNERGTAADMVKIDDRLPAHHHLHNGTHQRHHHRRRPRPRRRRRRRRRRRCRRRCRLDEPRNERETTHLSLAMSDERRPLDCW